MKRLRPNLWMEWREGQDASSTLGSDEAGDDDKDKATEPRRVIYVLIAALLEHRST